MLDGIRLRPHVLDYVTFPSISSAGEFEQEIWNQYIATSKQDCLLAIFQKSKPCTTVAGDEQPQFAGIMALAAASASHASVEVGVIVLPQFHGTGVATNATGLLLLWLLDPPHLGGLGLRRVEWQSHADNRASCRFAARIGFEFEGIARWQRTVAPGKLGTSASLLSSRNGTTTELSGKHVAVYSIVWDEWDQKRANIVVQMQRRQLRREVTLIS